MRHKEKHKELQRDDDDEDEWRYYHDPVMRPAKGHLWSTGMEEDGGEHGQENAWLQVGVRWIQSDPFKSRSRRGRNPSALFSTQLNTGGCQPRINSSD